MDAYRFIYQQNSVYFVNSFLNNNVLCWWVDTGAPNWVSDQCRRLLVNELSFLCAPWRGQIGKRVPVFPPLSPPAPLFSYVNRGVVLDPEDHLPFLGLWAPSTPDMSHCQCVFNQKALSTHGSYGPKSLFMKCTGVLFISHHMTKEVAARVPVDANMRKTHCLFFSDLMCNAA